MSSNAGERNPVSDETSPHLAGHRKHGKLSKLHRFDEVVLRDSLLRSLAKIPFRMSPLPPSSDDTDWTGLVRGARRGDPAAQAELVERLWPRVAGLAARLRTRDGEVEDIAQEVFLRVFTRLWQFRDGSFPAWVDRNATAIVTRLLGAIPPEQAWLTSVRVPEISGPSHGRDVEARVATAEISQWPPAVTTISSFSTSTRRAMAE